MLEGGCLCGAVAYEVDAKIGRALSLPDMPQDAWQCVFHPLAGEIPQVLLRCGSHVIAERPAQPVVLLRLGCLDTRINARPSAHIWRSDAADGYNPKDQLPELLKGR